MAKFMLGATERIKKDDSIPVELLPSNKMLYAAKLNTSEDADPAPVECNNLKQVFEKFRPSFSHVAALHDCGSSRPLWNTLPSACAW